MRRIEVYDTTLRDGAQAEGIDFSVQDKLLLTTRLAELHFDCVEGGYPASNAKDAEFFRRIDQPRLGQTRVCAFGMTRRKKTPVDKDEGIAALMKAGVRHVTLVGKGSAFQAREVLGTSLDENLAMIAESIAFLRDAGKEVTFDAEHFFDGWKADAKYALKTLRAAADAGAKRIVLCDTNGGSMTDEVAEITRAVVGQMPVPVGIHCHNDCGLAVANSLAAVDAGASQVQGTVNGFGERCGNADLIVVIANLALKKGYEVLQPDSVRHLTELSRYVYELVNMNYPAWQPFVGTSAFSHKGGMHVRDKSGDKSGDKVNRGTQYQLRWKQVTCRQISCARFPAGRPGCFRRQDRGRGDRAGAPGMSRGRFGWRQAALEVRFVRLIWRHAAFQAPVRVRAQTRITWPSRVALTCHIVDPSRFSTTDSSIDQPSRSINSCQWSNVVDMAQAIQNKCGLRTRSLPRYSPLYRQSWYRRMVSSGGAAPPRANAQAMRKFGKHRQEAGEIRGAPGQDR